MTNEGRRELVLGLLALDIELGRLGIWDAYGIVAFCNDADLDGRACRIVVRRWQAERAQGAIERVGAALGYEVA